MYVDVGQSRAAHYGCLSQEVVDLSRSLAGLLDRALKIADEKCKINIAALDALEPTSNQLPLDLPLPEGTRGKVQEGSCSGCCFCTNVHMNEPTPARPSEARNHIAFAASQVRRKNSKANCLFQHITCFRSSGPKTQYKHHVHDQLNHRPPTGNISTKRDADWLAIGPNPPRHTTTSAKRRPAPCVPPQPQNPDGTQRRRKPIFQPGKGPFHKKDTRKYRQPNANLVGAPAAAELILVTPWRLRCRRPTCSLNIYHM